MNERIQQFLDGELTRDQLTPAELRAAEQAQTLFSAIASSVPARPLPNLGPSVLSRLPEQQHSKGSWLWRPRPVAISWRPAYGFAMAAMLALIFGVRAFNGSNDAPEVREAIASGQVFVEFRLDAPGAQRVQLAGNFTNWQPAYSLKRGASGVWTIVVPMKPGVHDYAFVVDGARWTPDPTAPAVDDGFGGVNSRVAVLAPERQS
jgi:hypothetical protein